MTFLDAAGAGEIIDDSLALITTSVRNIGFIIPDCTIAEHHDDRLMVTNHPVELGAAITDHSFRLPATCTMEIGFSNSTAGTYGWVQEAYELMLALQRSRQPFSVTTGKRLYDNMLVTGLTTTTDQSTEFALMLQVDLQEVLITSTSYSSAPTSMGTAANQLMPQSTAAPTPAGPQASIPAPNAPTFSQGGSSLSFVPGT